MERMKNLLTDNFGSIVNEEVENEVFNVLMNTLLTQNYKDFVSASFYFMIYQLLSAFYCIIKDLLIFVNNNNSTCPTFC